MDQLVLFDYGTLDTETRTFVQQRTGEIKTLVRRAAQDIIEIGHKLIEVKERLGHGNFGAWLTTEFEWTHQTATSFMRVASRFGENEKILNFAPSALYLLASPSTPDDARAEALARAEQGERITYTTAREIVQEYKAPAPALAFALPDETEDSDEYEDDDEPDNRRYDPDEDVAYCKYCYVTHDSWSWRGDAWVCRLCDHATHDDYMQIPDKAPSEAEMAWHNQFAPEPPTPAAPTYNAEDRERRRQERLAEITKNNRPLDTGGQTYPVIYADPPWSYDFTLTDNRAIENHYPTMTIDEICALPVANVAAPDCALFLWATSPKLPEAIRLIEAWGFTYKTCMVWVKDKIGMGYYARQKHELLLIATRGDIPPPGPSDRPDSVIEAPRLEHSAKPTEFYEAIERMYPTLDKIEMFSRTPREGWQAWGNQVGETTRHDSASN